MNAGILAVANYVPDEIRPNSWWPDSVVERWRERKSDVAKMLRVQDDIASMTGGARMLAEAVMRNDSDPFQGGLERRIMPKEMKSSDMEIAAASEALRASGVSPNQIDFVLGHSAIPDYLHHSNSCLVHHRLGLPRGAFVMSAEGMCHAFLQQISLASELIRSGRFRYGLVFVSTALSRVMNPDEPFSPWFGDGAAAVVIGPVADDSGILWHASDTRGELHGSLVSGVKGKAWYDEGRVYSYLQSPALARQTMLVIPDDATRLLGEGLSRANVSAEEIDFFACHQPNAWLGGVVKDYLGLKNAKTTNTFSWTASLSAANIPTILNIAQKESMLKKGDLVAMFAGATGATSGALVVRWSC